MNVSVFARVAVACLVFIAGPNLGRAEGTVSATVGFDYSRGDYGEATETEILYLPATFKYEVDRWTLKGTLAWLQVTGPADTVIIDGQPVTRGNDSAETRESGPGDITASVAYAAYENAWAGVIVDLLGKIKLPTADDSKGLGSGKTDYALQVDGVKAAGDLSLLGTLGYRWLGEPEGVALRNVWYASAGALQRLSPDWSAGGIYDWREAASSNGSVQSEFTIYVVRRLDENMRLQGYLVRGFSDASPDWGIGAALTHRF